MPRFGNIELEALIGRGGMAEVYRGRFVDGPRAGWPVAIKRLSAERSADAVSVKLFLSEGELSKHLQHPNIVEVYEAGTRSGVTYIVMELVEGSDLARIIARANELNLDLPIDFCCFLVASIADGLHHAHVARHGTTRAPLGIVHCDVSPSNIFVSRTGEIKLGDFGVARAAGGPTVEGGTFGKLGYISPEQLRGDPVSASSDVYALGLLTYELLTGQRAFAADEPKQMLKLMRKRPRSPSALRPEIPAELDEAVLDTLDPRPDRRTATAAEFAERLRQGFDDRIGTPLAIAALVRGLFEASAVLPEGGRARPKTALGHAAARPPSKASSRPQSRSTSARPATRSNSARPATRGASARPATRSTSARPATRSSSAPPATRGHVGPLPPTGRPPPPPSTRRPTGHKGLHPALSPAPPPTDPFPLIVPARFEPLISVLGRLHRERGDALLQAEGAGNPRQLWIRQGHLIAASSQAPEEELGSLLAAAGRIGAADRARLQQAGAAASALLGKINLLPPEEIAAWLERQTVEILRGALRQAEGAALRPLSLVTPTCDRWVGEVVVAAFREGRVPRPAAPWPSGPCWRDPGALRDLGLSPQELRHINELASGQTPRPEAADEQLSRVLVALREMGILRHQV